MIFRDHTISLEKAKKAEKKSHSSQEFNQIKNALLALEKTSQYLAVETDIHQILTKIATEFGNSIGAMCVNFWNFAPDKQSVYIMAAYGMQEQYIINSRERPLKMGQAWIASAMQTGETIATSDAANDPRMPKSWLPAVKKQNYHGLVCMPLKRGDEIIGGMCFYFRDVHKFTFLEMMMANVVANQAATAVANSKLFSDLVSERNKTIAIIQSLNDGLILYDLEYKILLINNKAEEILGVKSDKVIGKYVNNDFAKKNIFFNNLFKLKNLSLEDFAHKEYSTEIPTKMVLEVTYIPVHDHLQKIGSMQMIRDISKEKEVELLKSNFVSVASHQLRTPLSGIKWSLDMLIKGDYGDLTEEQKNIIGKAYKTNGNLISLVSDLLNVSRLQEGKFDYSFELNSPMNLIKKIYNELKPVADRNNLDFKLELPIDGLPPISFDEKKLDLAIRNVVDNALKYTLPGGKVLVKAMHETISNAFVLIVNDNGVGIPKEQQKHIFTKFFRAKNAISLQTEGSGLGLFLAKEIIEQHNGILSFESSEDKGSEFSIYFPLDPEKMPAISN